VRSLPVAAPFAKDFERGYGRPLGTQEFLPILAEVRRARQDEPAKHGFDVKAILAASKKRQRRSRRKVVSFVQKNQKLSA